MHDLFDIDPWLTRRLRDAIRVLLLVGFLVAPAATFGFIEDQARRHAMHELRSLFPHVKFETGTAAPRVLH